MSPPCGHAWNHHPGPQLVLLAQLLGQCQGVFSSSVQLVKGRPETGKDLQTPQFCKAIPTHPWDDIVPRKNKPTSISPQHCVPLFHTQLLFPTSGFPHPDFSSATAVVGGTDLAQTGRVPHKLPLPTGSLEAIGGVSLSSTISGRWPFRPFPLPGSEANLYFLENSLKTEAWPSPHPELLEGRGDGHCGSGVCAPYAMLLSTVM